MNVAMVESAAQSIDAKLLISRLDDAGIQRAVVLSNAFVYGNPRPTALENEYERVKAENFTYRAGRLTIHLAREFGFCYGVDRAVDYAYQTRKRFPGRAVHLTGEIIHNPHVNDELRAMDVRFLSDAPDALDRLGPDDVVILPAFGVTVAEMEHLRATGCVLVDTTCGSVLNVWKNVHKYASEGFTAVIHGKHYHEETKATASQALTHPGGHYLCVRDKDEAEVVCGFLRGQAPASEIRARFAHAASPGFDPDRHLQHIGLANQTTMLMSETLKVQETLRRAMVERHGERDLEARFRAFDTICSATQERQDAVLEMLDAGHLDLMIVIGGYNSSNTQALARMCAPRVTTFYIDSPTCVAGTSIRHRVVGAAGESVTADWLPAGEVRVAITAGASTPDSVVGETIERILALRGQTAGDLTPPAQIAQGSSTSAEAAADKQSYA